MLDVRKNKNVTRQYIKNKIVKVINRGRGFNGYEENELAESIKNYDINFSWKLKNNEDDKNPYVFSGALFHALDVAGIKTEARTIDNLIGQGGVDKLKQLLDLKDGSSDENELTNRDYKVINVKNISDYISRNQDQYKKIPMLYQDDFFNKREANLKTELKDGIFIFSSGDATLQKGMEELIRKTSVTAQELCNDGCSKINPEVIGSDINNYLTLLLKRPNYLNMDSIKYLCLYSPDSIFSSVLQAAAHAAGYEQVILHPSLRVRGHKRSLNIKSLFTEDNVRILKNIVDKRASMDQAD